MNTSNPFQIPSCLQRANLQQRRQERFKKTVVVAVAAVAVLLVVLLIEGCVSEHAQTASTASPVVVVQTKAPPAKVAVSEPKVVPVLPPPAPATTQPPVTQPTLIYVVKHGDTLARIAKQHHTTAQQIKAINGLNSDLIAVGAKLKLPPV